MASTGETPISTSTASARSHDSNVYTSATSLNFFNTVTAVADWSEGDVKEWLQSVGFVDLAQVSEDHGIDGAVLIHLDFQSLKDLGFVKVGQRLRLMRLINELLGISEHLGFERSHMTGDPLNLECNLWNTVHGHHDRIRALENKVWALQQTTQTLRERTDSLSSVNTGWTLQSCPDSLALQSSKPSAESGHSTPPTTASPHRPAVTCTHSKTEEAYHFYNYTQSPLDGLNLSQPRRFSSIRTRRSSISPAARPGPSPRDPELSPYNSKTPLAIKSPKNVSLLPPFSQHFDLLAGPRASKPEGNSNSSSYNSSSSSNGVPGLVQSPRSGPASSQVKTATASSNGFVVARKPSLLTRRAGASSQGIGARTVRNGAVSSENRSAVVWKRSSSTTVLSSSFQDDVAHLRAATSPSRIDTKPGSSTTINRSASTSNLKAVHDGYDSKWGQRLKRLQSQPSVKVRSNNEQTAMEVLSNHLSTFYVNEPHAWSKHVLLLRMNDVKEYCLSYEEIPLKVYRSFKSKEGMDFAVRPIEDLPSPLRVAGNHRRRNPTFSLEEELAAMAPGDSKDLSDERGIYKTATERKPLACGLALCGYQAEQPEELNIRPGELFRIKSYSKGRYLLERESTLLLSSPLSAVSGTNWAQSPSPPTRGAASAGHSDHVGWVPESCILEITQSMRTATMKSNGSSLKHLISSALEDAEEFLDLENLTTRQICLISFRSQFITWSGELGRVVQGEKVRVFNNKSRFHWVYCMRESSGERGWLPKWILSSNLLVLPEPKYSEPQNKFQTYLLQQGSNQLRSSVARPHDHHASNRNAVLLGRSSSSGSALNKSGIRYPPSPSTLSPTSLHGLRALNLGKLGSDHLVDPPVPLQSLHSPHHPSIITPDSSTPYASNPATPTHHRFADTPRSVTFTPRSRRSRINSTLAP